MAGKKGMPVWGWLLIGCGGIVVLGLVAFLVLGGILFNKAKGFVEDAEANPAYGAIAPIAMVSPDIEIVDRNDANQSVTVRNKQTGEEVTVNLEDIENGKISWLTEDGEVTIETDQSGDGGMTMTSDEGQVTYGGTQIKAPSWVPRYAGATLATVTHSDIQGKAQGNLSFETSDDLETVIASLTQELEDAGWTVERSDFNQSVMLQAELNADQTMAITATTKAEQTKGSIIYAGPPN